MLSLSGPEKSLNWQDWQNEDDKNFFLSAPPSEEKNFYEPTLEDWEWYYREFGLGVGLSTLHISPVTVKISEPKISLRVDGSLMTVSRLRYVIPGMNRGGLRGSATFSFASRRRLMRLIASIKRGVLPVFVTLTYPGKYPLEPSIWKRHLDNFGKRFRRRFPGGSYVWKLEFQERGAPHYHLLVYGVSYFDLLEFVDLAWYEVVRSGDLRHLRAGTRVERVRDPNGVIFYASKYMTKREASLPGVGRFWGVVGRDLIPWSALITIPLQEKHAIVLVRYMRKMMRLRRGNRSLTMICHAHWWFTNYLDLLCGGRERRTGTHIPDVPN